MMQIGEAKISALAVAALTGAALTVLLAQALGNLTMALAISVPAAGVMGLVLFFFANDEIKKRDDKPPPKEKATEGK